MPKEENNKYERVIESAFRKRYKKGATNVPFTRDDLVEAHDELGLPRTKNIGDIPYSFRFRRDLPEFIRKAAPRNADWIIIGTGSASYEFRLASPGKILPSTDRERIPVLDATPEIVRQYAPGTDEQALLTRARYNRLVDMFLGLTCYSIQNHLRTTVEGIGQIEVDEIYIGLSKRGAHYVVPCQAKSPGDRFGIVQVMQDAELCRVKYPHAICRPVAMQFQGGNEVALLELSVTEEEGLFRLNVVEEKHYRLCHRSDFPADAVEILSKRERDGV